MRLSYPLYRLRQLLPTARRVYRQEGGLVLLNRVGRWLMGERGIDARIPPPEQKDAWRAWCEAHMTPNPMDVAYETKARFIVYTFDYSNQKEELYKTSASLQGIKGRHIGEHDSYLQIENLKQQDDKPEWILFIRVGWELLPQAKRYIDQAVRDHPNADVIYGDYIFGREDDIKPYFRPALIGPLLLADNIFEPLVIVRTQAFEDVGGFPTVSRFNWLWDLALELQRRGGEWVRINHPLSQRLDGMSYHRGYSNSTMLWSLRKHLTAMGLKDVAIKLEMPASGFVFRPLPSWALPDQHRVSIIIPNRDQPALLRQCLNSVLYRTIYDDFEVIVVDTGSTDPQTEAIYAWFADEPRFRLIRHSETPFNFSRACNVGAQQATGDFLLFLNNDTQILNPDWIQRMAQWFALPKTGIVGARLVYPDGTLQHAGVTVGLWGLAGHSRTGMPTDHDSVLGSDAWPRQMLAVTGACLMISRAVFDEVGGWDEGYQLNFSDVQLCLDVHTRGYQVIYAPEATVMHHEGQTHQRAVPRADFVRACEKFAPWLLSGDPSYHPALSYRTPHLAPNEDGHLPTMLNYEVMRRLPPDEWIQV